MIGPDDDPIDEILARLRDRAERLKRWLDQLRCGDPSPKLRLTTVGFCPGFRAFPGLGAVWLVATWSGGRAR
jgi:hypothetical protein